MGLLVIPNSFTAGAVISATEMNANFAAVQAAVNAIDSDKLVDGSVTAGKIGSGAVTEAKIATGAVSADKLASNAVTKAKILDANVTSAKLASGAALANIGAGGVTATYIGSSAVTTAKVNDGAITPAKTSFLGGFGAAGKIYVGYVGPDGSTGNSLPAGWSASRDSTGIYTITHSLNVATKDVVFLAIPNYGVTSGGYIALYSLTANALTIVANNGSGSLANTGFGFILVVRDS